MLRKCISPIWFAALAVACISNPTPTLTEYVEVKAAPKYVIPQLERHPARGLSVAIVDAKVESDQGDLGRPQAKEFLSAFRSLVVEIVESSGLEPVEAQSRDEMSYPDRVATHFVLKATFNLDWELSSNEKPGIGWYDIDGEAYKVGNVQTVALVKPELVLTIFEPVTDEKLYNKRIRLSEFDTEWNDLRSAIVGTDEFQIETDTSRVGFNRQNGIQRAYEALFAVATTDLQARLGPDFWSELEPHMTELKARKRF